VTMEDYYNDAGRQIPLLGKSVKLRYLQLLGQTVELAEEHYQGEYIVELARELLAERGDGLRDMPIDAFAAYARDRISRQQKETLARIGRKRWRPCGRAATSTSRTARSGFARLRLATIRTASS